MISVLPAVRSAYRAGLALLPVRADGSKAPDVPSWITFRTTRPTLAMLEEDWHFADRAGYGVLGGAVSGHLHPWDFDDEPTYNAFVADAHACGLGPVVDRIRNGYEDRTPSGGRRWLVRYPADVTFTDVVLARRPGRVGEPRVKTLIEITTFSILAPSNGATHPSGQPYTRMSGKFKTIASYTADEQDQLFALARSFDETPRQEARASRSTSSDGVRPGDDFNRRMSWSTLLEGHGWTHVYDRGDVSHWRRPGKTCGISATTNFAGADLFYPFSSSTEFDADKSYTKFGVLAVLEHGGDFAKAARQLAVDGYGEPVTTAGASSAAATVPTPAAARTVRLTPASAITVRPVRWLWDNRLSLGTLSLLGGREGIGKTLLAHTLAADLTRGRLDGVYAGMPRSVLVAATEDSWEHTITPRLMAAGADLARVFRVDVAAADGTALSLSLPQDVDALARVAREAEAALVVLDPLLSRLDAHLDTHKDAEVRRALEPLSAMAESADVTVLGLIHVNKSTSSDALNLLMASRAFPAVARNVLFVMTDPDDESQRLLGQAKNNLGRTDLPLLVFKIVNTLVASTPEGQVWTGQLHWLQPSTRTLRDTIERAGATRATDHGVVQDAAAWLEDYLTTEGGTAATATVIERGKEAGHSRSVLYLAKTALNLVSDYRDFPRISYWILPSSSCPRPQSPERPGTTEDSSRPEDNCRPGTTEDNCRGASVPVVQTPEDSQDVDNCGQLQGDEPDWVLAGDGACPSAEAPFAERDVSPQPGRCVVCDRPLTHPRAGEACARCRRRRSGAAVVTNEPA